MTSSPRHAEPTDAWIHQGQVIVGALKLPDQDPDQFIEQFNRRYEGLGLGIARKADRSEGTAGRLANAFATERQLASN